MKTYFKFNLPKIVIELCETLKKHDAQAYVVGGFVRDSILNISSKDIDIEVYNIDYKKLKNISQKFGLVNEVGKSFFVLKLMIKDLEIDISLPRTETKIGTGHKGFKINSLSTTDFKLGAKRRDFTINSMGYDPLTNKLIDPYSGFKDLQNKILRHVSHAFVEDPLRVYRAVQFAARFDLKIHHDTIILCKQCELNELPKERIFEEFKKLLLKSNKPSKGFNYFDELDILKHYPELKSIKNIPQDPEWHPEGDVWEHTMMVIDELANFDINDEKKKLTLMFAAICHDFGKATTTIKKDGRWRSPGHEQAGVKPSERFLKRFCNEKDLINNVKSLVNCHLRPAMLFNANQLQGVSDTAIKRLAMQVNIQDLYILAKADHFGRLTQDALKKEFPAGEWLLQRAKECKVKDSKPLPILMGRDLINLNIKPGIEMGKILKIAFEAQLEGNFKDKENAILWLKKYIKER